RWSVLDLVIGKFHFAEDRLGQRLLVRDEDEIAGVDPDLQPHREERRAADRFLTFVRAAARGEEPAADYVVPRAELKESPARRLTSTSLQPRPDIAPYSANSYTMTISGSQGSRWTTFPNPVSFYMGTTQEPGAPGGGSTAIQVAVNSWDNDCASNVNYVYAGADDGTHTQGLHAADGRNTVLFERDLSAWGVPPFTCSSSGYSGTLGLGGVTSASGSNTVSGETFVTTLEADVEMNRGLANCSLLFSNGDFNSAVTHEVGHTLGFRHSDQDRASSGSCSADPSLECSSSAIMTAFVTRGLNGALQAWDQHAVQAVYPGGTCGGCTLPTVSIAASASAITSGQSVTLSSSTTGGVTSYQWYIGSSGNTAQPIGGATGPTLVVNPTASTSYWLRVSNSCGSANSNTVSLTVTVSSGRKTPSDLNGDGRSDLVLRDTSTNAINLWLMNGTQPPVIRQLDRPPAGYVPVATGDIDGDGYADVLLRYTPSGMIYAYLMTANAALKSFVGIGPSIPSEIVVGTADFDHDGKDDILLDNPSNGEIAIWFMKGSGIASTKLLGGAASPWQAVAIGDLDGDGWPDVILQNSSTGQIVGWRTQNATIVATGSIGSPPPEVHVIAAGDVNGDGRADLLLQNVTNGWVTVLTMNGFSITSNRVVGTPGTSWVLKGRGDFNGDGVADIVTQNPSIGAVTVWLMSGGNIASISPAYGSGSSDVMVNR